MILDESLESRIDDAAMEEELRAASYGEDNRPAWIGAYRPATTCDALRGLATWAATHYDYYLAFVRDYVSRGDILDLGSGAGQNTAMLARYGNAVGVEPEVKGYEFALKHNSGSGARFINEVFPLSHNVPASDYIFCIEVIEHVEYEKQEVFVQAALDALRPGGLLFITTPNETSASGPHRGIWTPDWMGRMMGGFGKRVAWRGYMNNTDPGKFIDAPSTHHAVILS